MDDATFKAKLAWIAAREVTIAATYTLRITAKSVPNGNYASQPTPEYTNARIAYMIAIETEREAKRNYNAALAKQNFHKE